MTLTIVALLVVALGSPLIAAPQADASKLVLSAPVAIAEIDVGKLKGDLVRLAWSPDETEVYLQTAERDSRGNVRLRHYMKRLDAAAPKNVDQEPQWAGSYWAWKAGQAAPGLPAWKIQVEQERRRVTATATPSGGNMARGAPSPGADPGLGGSAGMSVEEAARAAEQSQMANVYTLKLKGEVIGEFVNAPAIPGVTFGWGPVDSGLIAFADRDGHVVIMDDQGRKQEVPSSKAALLPGWTSDGTRLAYLERSGRKKVTLRIAEIGARTP
jgi:hypothetical protein